MSWPARIRQRIRRALRGSRGEPAAGRSPRYFDAAEIGRICEIYNTEGTAQGTSWDALRDAHMRLPDWFRHGLDPLSPDYVAQQHRLWQLIAGVERPYDPEIDEKEHSWGDIDPVRTPGFFVRRDPAAIESASDHLIATGMILRHSGLRAGDWALEYGAGFGQTALTLARLGVNVDTVDISAMFCDYVQRQADFFQVPLHPFNGRFGTQPRPECQYDLIWFYESFHHCLDFQNVVRSLEAQLTKRGRIILGGEPIVENEYDAVPYPWGLRLHSEAIVAVRQRHWFELGFSECFLYKLFAEAGFFATRIDCEPTAFGRLYIFRRDQARVTTSERRP